MNGNDNWLLLLGLLPILALWLQFGIEVGVQRIRYEIKRRTQ